MLLKYYEYLDLNTKLAESTKRNYKGTVRRFLLYCLEVHSELTFTIKDINTFIAEKNKEDKSLHHYSYALIHFLASLGQHNKIPQVKKVAMMPRKKDFKFITMDKADDIISTLDYPWKDVAWIQLHTGMRFREAYSLKHDQIDFNSVPSAIRIYLSTSTKGKKQRYTWISRHHENRIREIITTASEHKRFNFIFIDNPQDITEWEVFYESKRRLYDHHLSIAAKPFENIRFIIGNFSSHYLRHIYSDNYLDVGGNIQDLQHQLGHSRIDTTQRYATRNDKSNISTITKL